MRAIAFFTRLYDVPVTLDGIGTIRTSTNGDGYVCFNNVPSGWTASHLTIPASPGYHPYSQHVTLPADGNHDFFLSDNPQPEGHPLGPNQSLMPPVERTSLPWITRSGMAFVTPTGGRWKMKGSTELVLGEIYDRGVNGVQGADAVRAILRDRKATGANTVRWLCQHQFRGQWLMPAAKIRELVDLCESEGFYSQVCVLADCWQDVPTQQARVAEVSHVLTGSTAALPQLGNEWNKNGFNPANFVKPNDGLLWANASTTEGFMGWGMVLPPWDYVTFSGQRTPLDKGILAYCAFEAQYEVAGCPTLIGEAMKPGVQTSDPLQFEKAGSIAYDGGFGHTVAGTSENCRLFNDVERACLTALFAAMSR